MLNEPHAVLEVCRVGQLGAEESPYGRQLYPGGQSRPRDEISCFHLFIVGTRSWWCFCLPHLLA